MRYYKNAIRQSRIFYPINIPNFNPAFLDPGGLSFARLKTDKVSATLNKKEDTSRYRWYSSGNGYRYVRFDYKEQIWDSVVYGICARRYSYRGYWSRY